MNVNNYRYVIEVGYLTGKTSAYDSTKNTFVTVFTLRAGKKDGSGTKEINAEGLYNSNILQFQTHYRAITDVMVIRYKNELYQINNISEVGYREGLLITCEKIRE